ncbi:MAG TPA: sialidase family protein, partial [Candidatus Thermoplasmatota archaeon]|nr:sialidase family protein [Candidatus Thermoplasmatota archaeon]
MPIPQSLAASMDRQWLIAGADGFVALFYSFFAPTPAGSPPVPVPVFGLDREARSIEAVYSHDHGETWSEPTSVVPAGDRYQIAHPRMLPDGTLWMPYGAVPPAGDTPYWRAPSEVRVAVSADQGATWRHSLVAAAPEGFDNLWAVQGATDPTTGLSFVAWSARIDDNHTALWLASSADLQAWSAPYAVDGLGINVLPWVDANAGRLTVGWYGTAATGEPTEVRGDAGWYALAAEWNATDRNGQPNATTMPIAYVSLQPVKSGPLCPRGAACEGDRELLDYVSMVYAPDGRVHYAFARSEGGQAFVHVATQ